VRSDEEHVAEYEPPANVEDGADLAERVLSGELAAVVGDVKHPELVPLLADAYEAADRYLRAHRNWPVNHLVVVRDELLHLAPAIVDAFERAKRLYLESAELEPAHARAAAVMGADPLPYGVEPNRAVLEELLDHAVAQRILRRRPTVDELFVGAG
jgi:4,5-dihydroxyphthalate decarboxylase